MILLPFLFLVVNTLYFRWVTQAIDSALLAEKYDEKIDELNILAIAVDGFIAENRNWGAYDYDTVIAPVAEYIDELPMTFAAVYRETYNGLYVVSHRAPSYENAPFEPLAYPEFVESIAENESGGVRVSFTPEGSDTRDVLVRFRWIPTDSDLAERYLVAVGISHYSISADIPQWVSVGQWVSMSATFALNVWLVVLAVELGHIRSLRKSDKWWGDGV